jgi:HK97 family phage prohead protease
MNVERRTATGKVETRAAAEGPKTIRGYGALFNVETVIGGYFREQIAPGAFDNVLAADVRSLFNHDDNFVLGRVPAGTLTLRADDTGLTYECTPPTTRADVLESVDRGDVTGSSFSFSVKRDEWTRPATAAELPLRTILEVGELFDVGPVTFPAYADTTAEARDAEAAASIVPADMRVAGDVAARERARLQLAVLEAEAAA